MSAFVIKIIAALTMFIDHMGLLLFPGEDIFRIIGRIAFPLYAYCIAEGFAHTRNRLKYFLQIFVLGALCQIVYAVVDRTLYLGILITFSLSLILLACMDSLRTSLAGEKSAAASLWEKSGLPLLSGEADKILSGLLTTLSLLGAYFLCRFVQVDYGFFGIMLPVFTGIGRDRKSRLALFSLGLILLCMDLAGNLPSQSWCLFTIPLLTLYNGKPGKYRLKYFFYLFYPLHLVLLYGLAYLL